MNLEKIEEVHKTSEVHIIPGGGIFSVPITSFNQKRIFVML